MDLPELEKAKPLEGLVLPSYMNVSRILFNSSDAKLLTPLISAPGATAIQSQIGVTYQPDTNGVSLTFNVVMGGTYEFTNGESITGSVIDTAATFIGTVTSCAAGVLVVVVDTADTSGLPPLSGWSFTTSTGTAVQSDSGMSFFPVVSTSAAYWITMVTGYQFLQGSIISGTVAGTSASFTATVISVDPYVVIVTYLTVNYPYVASLTNWNLTGTSGTPNYSDLRFNLSYPLKKVVYADYTFINTSWSAPFLLQIDEMNQNTSLTSKGAPYWRFINGANFTTNVLPIKLQLPRDYNALTFHITNTDGTPVLTGTDDWSIELLFYHREI